MASKHASSWKSKSEGRRCLCAPTSHPGSFRCSLHRNFNRLPPGRTKLVRVPPTHWKIPKANLINPFLIQILRPSTHDMQRRRNFQPKPSRFCLLNANTDAIGVDVS
ncbi:hypothetical protein ERO13_D08G102100v2 [Gossypium hirsutum]|uniref:Uncharacterized protein n=3 Tax=Gossypium TaxID=3633 RepID=A0A5J5QCT9_GOSBA|nr:hypothetical protein ES319_D08G109900v1 [Gossypium barbadense]KAG4133579.1 hypothetical protein ERO13_D08G102100v2 [Gossypium hirsutum]PPD83405.1 hypothetical protein GOBAR_DD19657 [Gossypium barbadense]TYG57107.1 hypothetical protein ES288_D08G116600v1 [Gossypium darwinii]TYI68817.1 hypothetical protein E1A91_D08G112900v1 [Gossypium mustelinum]